MRNWLLISAGVLSVIAIVFFLLPVSVTAQCPNDIVDCNTCGLEACQAPEGDLTLGLVAELSYSSTGCSASSVESLKCGRSKKCADIPYPEGCPGYGVEPPPPPYDPWLCRWVTITVSGYNSCTNCWMSSYAYICCKLAT